MAGRESPFEELYNIKEKVNIETQTEELKTEELKTEELKTISVSTQTLTSDEMVDVGCCDGFSLVKKGIKIMMDSFVEYLIKLI